LPGLVLGEVLDAFIAERTDHRNVLIRIRGAAIAAETEVPLDAGEKIQVRVESLQPKVVLSVVGRTHSEAGVVNEYLRLFRSSPKGMTDLMGALLDRLRSLETAGRLPGEGMLGELRRFLESLLLSRETAKDPLWLQKYVSGLGLLWEKGLLKACREPGADPGGKSLKSLLMKLFAEIRGGQADQPAGGVPAEAMAEIRGLSELLLKTIEAHQVVNIFSQERDGRFFIQVPFLGPQGVGAGDILIETEEGKGKGEPGKFAIRISLEMDALGVLRIDAGISGRSLRCSIQCAGEGIREFIAGSLDELAGGLRALGYRIDRLDCSIGKEIFDEPTAVLAGIGALDIKI